MTTVGVTTIRRAARDGDEGIGISSVVTAFAACNYATEDEVKANASSLTWLTKCPSVGADIKYVWKRTIISFTRNKASVTTYELVATYIFANGDDILGPLVRCKEAWVSGTEYVNNDSQIDVFYVVGTDGKRHWFKVRDGIASNSTNKTISPLEDTQGVIYTEAGSLAAFFSAQLLLAENCYLRCVSGGRFFIGETSNAVSGWLITEGAISYVKSDGTYGVQLTKDGYINDPDGLHFKVGGAVKKNTINLMPDPIFKDYAFGSANKSQLYYQRLANIDGLISPWHEDGGLMNLLYINESSSSVTNYYVNVGDTPRVRIETGKDYVFSVWVNTYLATSIEEFISTKISEISFYNTEEGTDNYTNRALRINMLYSTGSVKAYINGKSSKTKFAECLGVVGERGSWKQFAVKFNIPANANVYLTSSTSKITTYGTDAWFSWLPSIDVIANKSQYGVIYGACQLEQGTTPSCLVYDYEAVNRGNLLETGIDISNKTIDINADKFTVRNNSGQVNIGVNAQGDVMLRDLYAKNITVEGVLNNLVNTLESDDDRFILNGDSAYLDVLRLGSFVHIKSIPESFYGKTINLPYYIYEGTGCRTMTKYGGTLHEITANELRMLIGRKFFFTVDEDINDSTNCLLGTPYNLTSSQYIFGNTPITAEHYNRLILNNECYVDKYSEWNDRVYPMRIAPLNASIYELKPFYMRGNTTDITFVMIYVWTRTTFEISQTNLDVWWT